MQFIVQLIFKYLNINYFLFNSLLFIINFIILIYFKINIYFLKIKQMCIKNEIKPVNSSFDRLSLTNEKNPPY